MFKQLLANIVKTQWFNIQHKNARKWIPAVYVAPTRSYG